MERILSMESVRFEGPALTRRAWGEQRQDYLVAVDARDRDDAVGRVSAAISPYGAYSGFTADPP
jgi:hypothetical protein